MFMSLSKLLLECGYDSILGDFFFPSMLPFLPRCQEMFSCSPACSGVFLWCQSRSSQTRGLFPPHTGFWGVSRRLKLLVCSESALSVPACLGPWPCSLGHCGISPLGSQLPSFAFQGCPGRRGLVGPKGDKVSIQKNSGVSGVGCGANTTDRLGFFHPEGSGSS